MKYVSILGCGWLGTPLAKQLLDSGYRVKGSTTDSEKFKELERIGVKPYKINLSPEINSDYDQDFFEATTLFVMFPPDTREDIDDYFPYQFECLMNLIHRSPIQHIVFISSSCIYPSLNNVVTERDAINPETKKGKALMRVERMLQMEPDFTVTVVRMSEVYGEGRHPGAYLSGKKNIPNGRAPVNLIHQADAVNVLQRVLETPSCKGEVINVCAPGHPTREEFYRKAAVDGGFSAPVFLDEPVRSYNVISTEKLNRLVNYKFIHDNPYHSYC
ncbi:NAD(P)-dependent oxidoreductase (plasmid) [Fulvitalea axinellae]|uniref:NAD(P)-dependent oxidoreductase n=1 Tax=Fulvitalea axinellae TaxID=1182444 RepID=A0AAU9CJH6_9BACT|nr:NAD(P)-dependent oxidoreductase [Fulvitalea axinellae]